MNMGCIVDEWTKSREGTLKYSILLSSNASQTLVTKMLVLVVSKLIFFLTHGRTLK